MFYYGIENTDSHMVELSKLIHLSTIEIEGAVKGIRSIKDPRYIEERCIEVNRLENLADDVLAHAVTDLLRPLMQSRLSSSRISMSILKRRPIIARTWQTYSPISPSGTREVMLLKQW